jgi:hypothetical protein
MNLHCKKPRPLAREEKTYRDDRLCIIATEDTHAPEQYFRIFRDSKIKVRVLPTGDGLSAPQHVFDRLDAFAEEFDLMDEDELWLMLDTDHWVKADHIANFNNVCAQAVQKRFNLAHSNPCFEVWLLLHLVDLDPIRQFKSCGEVVRYLKDTLGGYSKRTIDSQQFSLDKVAAAIERAEKLDHSPQDRWPQKTGSHVYRLVKRLAHATPRE